MSRGNMIVRTGGNDNKSNMKFFASRLHILCSRHFVVYYQFFFAVPVLYIDRSAGPILLCFLVIFH